MDVPLLFHPRFCRIFFLFNPLATRASRRTAFARLVATPFVNGSHAVRGRKRQSASIRDVKGNPGKRLRTGGKKTKPPASAVDAKPADLAVPPNIGR